VRIEVIADRLLPPVVMIDGTISSAVRFKTDGVAGFGTVRIGCTLSK
jgi:hypothetical protein